VNPDPSGSQGSKVQFRGWRQLVGNLICTVAGLILFIVLAVSIAETPSSSRGHGGTAAFAVSLFVIAAAIGLLIRMRWAFTVELDGDTLTYRSLLRTVHFARSDISKIGLEERNRGLMKIAQPYLVLADGRVKWLADMGQGKLIARESTMQRDLVSSVSHWIAQPA
jgi:hypothetical protein